LLAYFFYDIIEVMNRPTIKTFSKIKTFLRDPKVARFIFPMLVVFVVGSFFLIKAEPAQAVDFWSLFKAPGILVGWIIAAVLAIILGCVGLLVYMLILLLIVVASYNGFTTAPAVVKGWVVVRDIGNMVFIVALLIIAIATILKIETYQWKKALPKLIIMAVLINFSKTICGLFIDFSQVVMMTFINAFKTGGTGILASFVGIGEGLTAKTGAEAVLDTVFNYDKVIASLGLAIIKALIAGVVICVMFIVLLARMAMLWILIVLSPLAFALASFPQGQKYASQWWQKFGNYVIVGPLLAFFLWLSFATISGQNAASQIISPGELAKIDNPPEIGSSEAGGWESVLSFAIGIAMLIGGLMLTQQLGVAGGALAGKAVGGIQKAGVGAVSWGERKMYAGEVPGLKFMKGIGLNPMRAIKGIQDRFAEKKREDEQKGESTAGSLVKKGGWKALLGATGASHDFANDYFQGFAYGRGFKRLIKGTESKLNKASEEYGAANEVAKKAASRAKNMMTNPEKQQQINEFELERQNVNKQFDSRVEAETDEEKKKLIENERNQQINRINEDIEGVKKTETVDEATKEQAFKEAQEKRKEADELGRKERDVMAWMPQDYYAQQSRRSAMNEEKKKIDTDNSDELVGYAHAAEINDNPTQMGAVLMQAMSVGHVNEVLKAYGEKFKTSDKEEERVLGDMFSKANGTALNAFVNNILIGKSGGQQNAKDMAKELQKEKPLEFGTFEKAMVEAIKRGGSVLGGMKMEKQEAYALEQDISSKGKSIRWLTYQETMGSRGGQFYQRSESEKEQANFIERGKMRTRSLLGEGNRAAWGIDFVDEKGNKDFTFDAGALRQLVNEVGTTKYALERGEVNESAAQHWVLPTGLKQISAQWDATYGKDGVATYQDKGKTVPMTKEDYFSMLKTYGGKPGKEEGVASMILNTQAAKDLSNIQIDVKNDAHVAVNNAVQQVLKDKGINRSEADSVMGMGFAAKQKLFLPLLADIKKNLKDKTDELSEKVKTQVDILSHSLGSEEDFAGIMEQRLKVLLSKFL
jgi:hypothetical protein